MVIRRPRSYKVNVPQGLIIRFQYGSDTRYEVSVDFESMNSFGVTGLSSGNSGRPMGREICFVQE